MLYKIKDGSDCHRCACPTDACLSRFAHIHAESVFMNVESKRLFVFMCDGAECSLLCEVEEEV